MFLNYEKKGRIAIFTLNRPDVLNALNSQLQSELREALVDFRDDNELWVGIITGAGEKAFCAGADIKEFLPTLKENLDRLWAIPPPLKHGFELWKPIIAAINGWCLGGGLELALACDIRIASENARLGLAEVTVGMMPGGGGTQRLPRAIPLAKAAEMIFTGRPIDSQEAYRIGLVNKVVPLGQLMSAAIEMAEDICKVGPLAVRASKQALYTGIDISLEKGLLFERAMMERIMKTEDFIEGTKAFVEKRKPKFEGK